MNAPVKSAALLFSCVAALAPPAQAVGFTITPAKDAIVEGADVSWMKISVADGTETVGAALAEDDGISSITPAPEASTIFLMGAGALVIAGAMRVNRSRARKE